MSTISFHKPTCSSSKFTITSNLCNNMINHGTNPRLSKSNKITSSKNTPKSFITQENTVGIIGGLSPLTTLTFLEKLVHFGSNNNQECVPFVVCSDPTILKQQLLVHRSTVYAKHVPNDGVIVENLRAKREFLQESGSRCIVMPCYVSYLWYEQVFKDCCVTSLNIFDCVAQEVKEANMKPTVAGGSVRVGVLASDLVAGFYQKKLEIEGLEAVLPDKPTMEHMIKPAIEALNKKDTEGAKNLLRIAIYSLLLASVDVVILCFDEFQGLLPHDDPLLNRCLDPMDSLARSTIKWAYSDAKIHTNFRGLSKV